MGFVCMTYTATVISFYCARYIHLQRPGNTQESWVTWHWKEATSNLQQYVGLALPGAILMWAEWWCAEILTLLAGLLGVSALASHAIVLQCFLLLWTVSCGFSNAAASLVGNAIGAWDSGLARRTACMISLVMVVAVVVIDVAFI